VAQLERIACAYRYLFTTDVLEELTALLLSKFGPDFGHVLYCCSGSEAVEAALKVALQFWHSRGLRDKCHFIARERSYHGTTLGALSMSGFAERRLPFEGSLLDVTFVSAANVYRPAGGLRHRNWSPPWRPSSKSALFASVRSGSPVSSSSRWWVRPVASFPRRQDMLKPSEPFVTAMMFC